MMHGHSTLTWLRKAAEQGHAEAQFNFAWVHIHGHGVPKDRLKAYFWFLLASNQMPSLAAGACVDLESKLSPTQCAAVQSDVRTWKPSAA